MRAVLHVIPAVAARYGGPSLAVVGLCRALERTGMRTMIATTDADGAGRLRVQTGERVDYEGLSAIFFRRHFGEAFKWSSGLGSWLQSNVARFDLVEIHAVFSHSSLAAARACRLAGVPYVVRPLGTLDPWSLSRKQRRKQWLMRFGVNDLLTGAHAMHYTTVDEMRLAEAALPGLPPGFVVPLGIDDAWFASPQARASVSKENPYVLFLARLHPKKGVGLLIDAFHKVTSDPRLAQWRLIVAGDGDARHVSELRALARRGPAGQNIEFCGWIEGDAKLALVRGASLFVLPSHQENFGLSVVEAMASGIPVVVTPGVNLATDIEAAGAGWIVDLSSDALASTLVSALNDPVARRSRGESAARLAANFKWSGVAEQLRAAYADVARLQPAVRPHS